jgi:cold shock CspA family protein
MRGIVKKIDERGFGIIDSADGTKIPFILSGLLHNYILVPGQKVVFSICRVKDRVFAENVSPRQGQTLKGPTSRGTALTPERKRKHVPQGLLGWRTRGRW